MLYWLRERKIWQLLSWWCNFLFPSTHNASPLPCLIRPSLRLYSEPTVHILLLFKVIYLSVIVGSRPTPPVSSSPSSNAVWSHFSFASDSHQDNLDQSQNCYRIFRSVAHKDSNPQTHLRGGKQRKENFAYFGNKSMYTNLPQTSHFTHSQTNVAQTRLRWSSDLEIIFLLS